CGRALRTRPDAPPCWASSGTAAGLRPETELGRLLGFGGGTLNRGERRGAGSVDEASIEAGRGLGGVGASGRGSPIRVGTTDPKSTGRKSAGGVSMGRGSVRAALAARAMRLPGL